MKRRVGVLISGRGSNLKALVNASREPDCPYEIIIVASDNPDAPGLGWAEANGIMTVATPKGMATQAREAEFERAFTGRRVEVLALAGYMRLLSDGFVERWRGRVVNIHPSLLPKYKGLDTHARALAAGDAVAGASVHLVTEELDGGAVLGQAQVDVEPSDTPETLAARVLEAEHELYPAVLRAFLCR